MSRKTAMAGNLYVLTALALALVARAAVAQCPSQTLRWDDRFGFSGTNASVEALAVPAAGSLFAGGSFSIAGGTNICYGAAQWNGVYWQPLGGGMNNGGRVSVIYPYGNKLYMGGDFTEAYRTPGVCGSNPVSVDRIAIWNIAVRTWEQLGYDLSGGITIPASLDGSVEAIEFYSGFLYFGGSLGTGTQPRSPLDPEEQIVLSGIAQWNWNTNPKTFKSLTADGGTGVSGMVWAMAAQGNYLYVGGNLSRVGNVTTIGIGQWRDPDPHLDPNGNESWSDVGGGLGSGGRVLALAVYNNVLYVGGSFLRVGGASGPLARNIATWNGSTWGTIGGGSIPGLNNQVRAMRVWNDGTGNALYVAGEFDRTGDASVTGLNGIAKFNGTTFSGLGSGLDADPTARALGTGTVTNLSVPGCPVDRALYVGGDFTQAGGNPVENVARWGPEIGTRPCCVLSDLSCIEVKPEECAMAGNLVALDIDPPTCAAGQGDADSDGVIDVCDNCPDHYNPGQEDCDSNGIGDICEIANCSPDDRYCQDCNSNGIPDGCDLTNCPPGDPSCADCNGNSRPDSCDIAVGTSTDSNSNGIPDDCEVEAGFTLRRNQQCVPGTLTVYLDLELNSPPLKVEEAEFFLDFDNTALSFTSLTNVANPPFAEVTRDINQGAGTIHYQMRTTPGNGVLTGRTMVEIRFSRLAERCVAASLVTFDRGQDNHITDELGTDSLPSMTDLPQTWLDGTAPTFSPAPSNQTVECDGGGNQAQLNAWLAAPQASDSCDPNPITVNNTFSGLSNLCGATGAANVTFSAQDSCNNLRTAGASFVIQDTTIPSLSCPSDQSLAASQDECLVTIPNLASAATASDVCGSVAKSQLPTSGTQVQDDTTVTITAQDECSLINTCEVEITVTNNDPPQITSLTPPSPHNANCGDRVELEVVASSSRSLSYQWLYNGNPTGVTTSIFVIDPAYPSHNGSYSVEVTDACGTVLSNTIALTVGGCGPTINVHPQDDIACQNGNASFTVQATASVPPLNYQWHRDGLSIANGPTGNGSTFQGVTTSALTILNVAPADAGIDRYTVEVGDASGPITVTSEPASLDVDTYPTITAPDDLTVNSDLEQCSVVLEPPAPGSPSVGDDRTPVGNLVVNFSRSDGKPNLTSPYDVDDSPITITWSVTDECGSTVQDTQIITVRPYNDFVVDVEFSPTLDDDGVAGNNTTLIRCVIFELHDCSSGQSVQVQQEIVVPVDVTNTPPHAVQDVLLEVPVNCGSPRQYTCVQAWDALHTLISTAASLDKLGTKQYYASFEGERADEGGSGHRLVGGNLSGDNWIDVLDFGYYVKRFGDNYGSGDTDCTMSGPHADITGDGVVGIGDFGFMQSNFLMGNESSCCSPLRGGSDDSGPVLKISLAELAERGYEDLSAADLNGDGSLDQQDLAAFMGGARPTIESRPMRDRPDLQQLAPASNQAVKPQLERRTPAEPMDTLNRR